MGLEILSTQSKSYIPLLFRIPDVQSSVVSTQNPILSLVKERFQSLLNGAQQSSFNTPLQFYSWIPTQHIQLNLGLLHNLGFQWNVAKWISRFSIQNFQSSPNLQALFQNLITQGTVANKSRPSTSPEKQIQANLKQRILNPEPAVAQKLQEINHKRMQQGKPALDFKAVTLEIENIMSNAALSDKEKKKQIGAIRKRLGLGKKDMKTLFTQRLKTIYQEASQQIQVQLQNTTNPVEKQRLTTLLQSYESKASLYNSMFKSFWSKLGAAFKKIGGFFKKVAGGIFKIVNFVSPFLKFIPGIGQIAVLARSTFGKVFQFFKDKISKVAKPFNHFLSSPIGEMVQPWLNQTSTYLRNLIQN